MKYNPPAGSQDPDAKYVTGQPGKVRGSAVPAEAVEHPQREIVEVIRQAGLEPSGDDLGQLWKALQQLFTEKVAVATKEKAGIVKPGSGLSVKEDGTLDVTVSAAIPGTIVAFAGTFGGEGNRHPIPLGGSEPDTGWVLCDGGSDGKGGTVPDLRGRMIMGVSDAYKAGSTGGSANHSHSLSGTVGATTLTEAQLASHTHKIRLASNSNSGNGLDAGKGSATVMESNRVATTGDSQPHTHTLSGVSGEASSLPPYYVLSYVMRCA
ncbi:hypothetical protein [Desulfovibrio piger]|uniref:hypothetical protein n=1 Tax=Desulfovibrio piger TaxID=901 RepID=UPI0026F01F95|nr:hypothetical protein [Desulfovibrio piger]